MNARWSGHKQFPPGAVWTYLPRVWHLSPGCYIERYYETAKKDSKCTWVRKSYMPIKLGGGGGLIQKELQSRKHPNNSFSTFLNPLIQQIPASNRAKKTFQTRKII